MVEISKADWKLFRERIGNWQERYMEKLSKEYDPDGNLIEVGTPT